MSYKDKMIEIEDLIVERDALRAQVVDLEGRCAVIDMRLDKMWAEMNRAAKAAERKER